MDYKTLDLKIGLEIHRQIDTHKLFCSCPSVLSEKVDYKIKRMLRAVSSELGRGDKVAKYEMGKNRYAIYESSNENSCLVELDDEPIHNINKRALDTVLLVAKMLNCKFADVIQVMRKQVIDYSNTSGFQRTMLIAFNGFLNISKGKVRIENICLEEDAARKIKDENEFVVYRLDRLGIPLIEISTYPDIKSPEQAKEVAEHLGMILKSTGRFKSGLGTIRQDLNLSIKGGKRVELKGVQDLHNIPKIIKIEIERQINLLNQNKEIDKEVRRVLEDCSTEYLRPMPDSSRLYVETDHPLIFLTTQILNSLEKVELISEKIENLEEKYGINAEIAGQLVKENKLELFKELIIYGDPKLIAKTLVLTLKDIKARLNVDINKLKKEDFILIFKNIKEGKINKNAIENVLVDILKGEKLNLELYKGVNEKEIEKEIKKIIVVNKDLPIGGIMGRVMDKYRGLVDGKKVMEMIKELK